MSGAFFLDTNVLVYASLSPDPRSQAARDLLARRGQISAQVLNEFANVANRRLGMPWPEIKRAVDAILKLCPPPHAITLGIHEAGRAIAERYQYAFYDSLIIASALDAKCGTLFSEDLRDGQVIDGCLTIRNPFRT